MPGNGMNTGGSVLEDPKLLVVIIIYSGVAGVALSAFPPLGQLNYFDLLRYHILAFLVARITTTYGYAEVARTYAMQMFILELVIAILVAGQLRSIENLATANLVYFYAFHLLLMGSAFVWNTIGGKEAVILRKHRFVRIRLVSSLWVGVGILGEISSDLEPYREMLRWIIALYFAITTTFYVRSKPWELRDV